MYLKFSSHDTSKGSSSKDYFDYLEKENVLNENEKENDSENLLIRNSQFFNSDKDLENNFVGFDKNLVTNNIDNNLSNRSKDEANFYKLDISPSQKELTQIKNIAEIELKNRNILEGNDEYSKSVYEVHRNELIEQGLREYANDVMKQYAERFNREIYVNEDKLPNITEKKDILKSTENIYNEVFLKNSFEELYKEKNVKSEILSYQNFSNIEEKEKVVSATVKLNNKDYEIEIPKNLVLNSKDEKGNISFKNNEIKLPENFYKEKVEDILKRNNTVEIKFDFKSEVTSKKNDKSYLVFNGSHKNLSKNFDVVIDKNDLIIKNGKYYINEKLLELKYKSSLTKSVEEQYPKLKTDIYDKIAAKKGFDVTKRALTEKDLLWYGKVEKERTWKADDSIIIKNTEIVKKIQNSKSNSEKKELEKQLVKNNKGEVVHKGMKKDGLNYHIHVVVSRHDKTMKNPENKISLSPMANAKEGNNIGFNRKEFMKESINVFDKKFEYNRNENERYLDKTKGRNDELIENKIKGQVNSKAEREVKKLIGLNEIQRELKFVNISLTHKPSLTISPIKEQIGLNNLPNIKLSTVISNPKKAVIDIAVGAVKKIIGLDSGY